MSKRYPTQDEKDTRAKRAKLNERLRVLQREIDGTPINSDDMDVLLQDYRIIKLQLQQLNRKWSKDGSTWLTELSIPEHRPNPYRN